MISPRRIVGFGAPVLSSAQIPMEEAAVFIFRSYLICLAAVLAATGAGAEVVDRVVAIVDREVILQSEIEYQLSPLMQQMAGEDGVTYSQANLRDAFQMALDQAIEQKILYREALLSGVEMGDFDVDARLNEIQATYDSPDAFREAVEASGETMSEIRERLQTQMVAMGFAAFKRREFAKEAVISEGMAEEFYQNAQGEFAQPERVQARRIFLSAGKNAEERAAVRARIEALRAELVAGGDFAEAAKAQSEGPDAEAGGLVGWVSRGDLVAELDAAVFALAPGEISPVIETDFGFQILKAEAREEAGKASLDEARKDIEPMLRDKYAAERYEKWIGELRKRSRVRVFTE